MISGISRGCAIPTSSPRRGYKEYLGPYCSRLPRWGTINLRVLNGIQ